MSMLNQLKSKRVVFSVGLLLAASFLVFVIQRAYHPQASADANTIAASNPQSLMNKPLPPAILLDSSGSRLEDKLLRKGKVVLVFLATDCAACETEALFLKTAMEKKQQDVSFYGVVSFGNPSAGKSGEDKFPFKLFFDQEPRLAAQLGLSRVPIKVFLEDGIIRKAWKGATISQEQRMAFEGWLENPH